MTLRNFLENSNYEWSFDYNQIEAYRLIESDGYGDYSYDEMFCYPSRALSERVLRKKIAFMVYDPRNSTMNVFLEE